MKPGQCKVVPVVHVEIPAVLHGYKGVGAFFGCGVRAATRLCKEVFPEAVRMEPREGWRRYELPVQDIQYLGDTYEITLSHEGKTWMLHGAHKTAPGEKLSIYINPEEIISC